MVTPRLSDGWMGFRLFCPLLALFFIQALLFLAGFVALIIPGFYLCTAMSFALFIYLEYQSLGLTPWESIKLSIVLVNRKFCDIFGFLMLCYLIELAGVICVFGVVVAYPVTSLAMMVAFRDIVGFRDEVFPVGQIPMV